jgi:hypothetical protein
VGPDPVDRVEGGVMAETLRRWVRRAEQDAGVRPGSTSAETERIRELERAKTANYVGQTEILKAASRPSTATLVTFVTEYKDRFGVEPSCEFGVKIASSTYYVALTRLKSAREIRDEELQRLMQRVYDENYKVYGARKMWWELHREGIGVGRCRVERLMPNMGLVRNNGSGRRGSRGGAGAHHCVR